MLFERERERENEDRKTLLFGYLRERKSERKRKKEREQRKPHCYLMCERKKEKERKREKINMSLFGKSSVALGLFDILKTVCQGYVMCSCKRQYRSSLPPPLPPLPRAIIRSVEEEIEVPRREVYV